MILLSNQALFRLLLGVVALAPLPLGSHRPWAWSLLGVAVGVLLLAWAVGVARRGGRLGVPLNRLAWPGIPMGLVIVWAALQTIPWAPDHWAHPLWAEASLALGAPVPETVSLDPTLSRTALMRLLTYAGVFWLAVQLGRDRSRAHLAVVTLAVAGLLYAAYGLAMHMMGIERILWLEKWAYLGDLTSTFVNRNSYGSYAGIGLLSCTALLLHAVRRRSRGLAREQVYDRVQGVILTLAAVASGVVVIGSAILMTHSRGAFLSTVAGVAALLAAAVVSRMIRPRTTLVLMGLLGLLLAGAVATSGQQTAERLISTVEANSEDARHVLYARTLGAIADAPLAGHGLGTFLPVFRMHRDIQLSTPLVWDFAHNSYLETALDLGLPGAGLFFGSIAVVLAVCLRGLVVRRRDHIYPALAVAVAVLEGCHSLFDFSAQMPAVAMTLSLLLGIGYAQSWPSSERASSG